MKPEQIRSFVERYLTTNDCQIIQSTPEMIEAQLSIEADQDLLNRPLYWMYVQKMQLPPQPVRFRFFFQECEDSRKIYSDHLYLGAPRFTQMLQSAQKRGRFVRLYQIPAIPKTHWPNPKGYDPVLAIQYQISYICDQKKDRLVSLAIHLQTGEIKENFYTWAQQQKWSQQLPPARYIKPAQLSLTQAVGKCEEFLQAQIEQEDHTWLNEANQRVQEECAQAEQYYPESPSMTEEDQQAKKQRLREIIWQYQPRIEIGTINAGLFYTDSPI